MSFNTSDSDSSASKINHDFIPYWMDQSELDQIFDDETTVTVKLYRLKNPSIIWMNERIIPTDPAFITCGRDIDLYKKYIIETCAYVTYEEGIHEKIIKDDSIYACSDRYGGSAIGTNGGSGRAAFISTYVVKGIGRTPLVGVHTDSSHANGGAYLEESTRESIFSEIVAYEFPHSSIPNLAIIDTGLVQEWNLNGSVKTERRVLLIRPNFIRPAHMERAIYYLSSNPLEGSRDNIRVDRIIENLVNKITKQGLLNEVENFFGSWARQLAYGYIHRIGLGGNTTSNICLDGKLLDFGAMSALPSWGNITMISSLAPTGTEFQVIPIAISNILYYINRKSIDHAIYSKEVEKLILSSWSAYLREYFVETLRLCGLSTEAAIEMIEGDDRTRVKSVIDHVHKWYRKNNFDVIDFTPIVTLGQSIVEVWNNPVPSHLTELRKLLEESFNPDELLIHSLNAAIKNLSRPKLFREEMKDRIYKIIEKTNESPLIDIDFLKNFIQKEIVMGRRDTRLVLPPNSFILAFCLGDDFSVIVTVCMKTKEYSGLIEWLSPSSLLNIVLEKEDLTTALNHSHRIKTISSNRLEFEALPNVYFSCVVNNPSSSYCP